LLIYRWIDYVVLEGLKGAMTEVFEEDDLESQVTSASPTKPISVSSPKNLSSES
jgi:hypothetical protein